MTAPYYVITEPTGWSFIVDRRDGPCRYRSEADQVADEMNRKEAHDHPEA